MRALGGGVSMCSWQVVRRFVGLLVIVACMLGVTALGEDEISILQSGQDVQEAIDQAPEGAEIHLSPGLYLGGLVIAKSLVIKGTGDHRDDVRIVGGSPGKPVIRVDSEVQISVRIENLSLLGATGDCPADGAIVCTPGPNGVEVEGRVSVSITGVRIAENAKHGIVVVWPASVDVADSVIHNNGSDGMLCPGGRITVRACSIWSNGRSGIHAWGNVDLAQLTVTETSIMNNQQGGVSLFGATSVLEGCTILGNDVGIRLFCKSRVTITRNCVYNNQSAGIQVHISTCSFDGYSAAYEFEGEIQGDGNYVAENGEDLCPSWALSGLIEDGGGYEFKVEEPGVIPGDKDTATSEGEDSIASSPPEVFTTIYADLTRIGIEAASSTLSASRINSSQDERNEMPNDTILIFRTDEGKLGKAFIMDNTGVHAMAFAYVIYSDDGSVWYESVGSSVRSTWKFDLESDSEGREGADLWWEHTEFHGGGQPGDPIYLTPLNSALFAIYHWEMAPGVETPLPLNGSACTYPEAVGQLVWEFWEIDQELASTYGSPWTDERYRAIARLNEDLLSKAIDIHDTLKVDTHRELLEGMIVACETFKSSPYKTHAELWLAGKVSEGNDALAARNDALYVLFSAARQVEIGMLDLCPSVEIHPWSLHFKG